MADRFTIGEALGAGWRIVRKSLGFLAGFVLVALLLSGVPSALSQVFREDAPGASAIFSLVSLFFSVVVAMGFITVRLKLVDGEGASFRALLANWPVFLKYLGGAIIYVLIVLCGLVLFVVPGIIWSIQFMFWSYHVVDGRTGLVEAFKKSAEDTRGQKVHLFGLALVLFGINMLGLLAIVVGLWLHRQGVNLTIPSILALVIMYVTVIYGNTGWLGTANDWLADWPIIVWAAALLVTGASRTPHSAGPRDPRAPVSPNRETERSCLSIRAPGVSSSRRHGRAPSVRWSVRRACTRSYL